MIESVRLKTSIASPDWSYVKGDEAVVGDKIDHDEAVRWVKAGIADVEKGKMPAEPEEPVGAEQLTAEQSTEEAGQPEPTPSPEPEEAPKATDKPKRTKNK